MALKETLAIKLMEEISEGSIIAPSLTQFPEGWLALVNTANKKQLVCICSTKWELLEKWQVEKSIEKDKNTILLMDLTPNNAAIIRHIIKWASPTACGSKGLSIGINDSESLNLVEKLKPFENKMIKPVIVKYPENPNNENPRNLLVAVDTATWGILEAGYKEGYGVIASGISSEEDIVKCLLYGYSMISIDCSSKINTDIENLTDEQVKIRYNELPEEFRDAMAKSYLEKDFQLNDQIIHFTPEILYRAVLQYGEAIMFAQNLYQTYLSNTPWDIDFEVSLVKNDKITSPQEHFLVSFELTRNKVKLASIELNGENKEAILTDLVIHSAIANEFDYRLAFKNSDQLLEELDSLKKIINNKGFFKTK